MTMTNALTTTECATREVGSIFDDMASYQNALEMARMLCKTQLIPQNFHNKPEDCLIALDYSRRLRVPPTAIMPHLYVIHGRPSVSAQFMIAMVNRSGKFSRIVWDEGIDGEVEFFSNGTRKKIPNYYATATFTEQTTGNVYKSTRVDMKVALSNGWLSKNDSMWQKTPQIMCRYRSASILVKTACPELVFGMETVEDARDSFLEDPATERTDEKVRRQTVVMTPNGVSYEEEETIQDAVVDYPSASPFAELAQRIDDAATLDALATVAKEIGNSPLNEDELTQLRDLYKRKKGFFVQSAPQPEEPHEPQVTEPTPSVAAAPAKKTRRGKKTEYIQPGENMVTHIELARNIENASTLYECKVIDYQITTAEKQERVDATTAESLRKSLAARQEQIASGSSETATPENGNADVSTIEDLEELLKELKSCDDGVKIYHESERLLKEGRITQEQYDNLVQAMRERCEQINDAQEGN